MFKCFEGEHVLLTNCRLKVHNFPNPFKSAKAHKQKFTKSAINNQAALNDIRFARCIKKCRH